MKQCIRKVLSYSSVEWSIILNALYIAIVLFELLDQKIHVFGVSYSHYFLIAVCIVGVAPVIWSAIIALIRRKITIDLLASIALVFSFLDGQWVSAAFINLMLASARLFDAFTERRTQNILSKLLKLRPDHVHVQKGNSVVLVPLEQVVAGDLVVIEAGSRIPVDGVVVTGQASVDESTLTGESEPVLKKAGSSVFSSTLSVSGSLVVRAERVGADTTLSKMIALVDEASRAKTKVERLADRFSFWYITIMLVASGVIYLFSHDISLVLAVLLVVCADDIAVAVPLGFTISIAKAARHGLIIKGASVLERVRSIQVIVTDKTGTLTRGTARVYQEILSEGSSLETFHTMAGHATLESTHPVSTAILAYLKEQKVSIVAPDEAQEFPGEGVVIKKDGHSIVQGKVSFLKERNVLIKEQEEEKMKQAELAGGSINALALDGVFVGAFVLEDELRRFAKEVIAETKSMGIKKWIMLTGDNAVVAKRVADKVGIEEFHAELSPEGKIAMLRDIKKKYGSIAMIGDGVNDAAALAMADVSFAMGAIGSDVSIEAADIAIMHDDLRRIPETLFLGREATKIIKQNFLIWAVTNIVGLTLVFSGYIGPVGAALYNFLTDFIPIMNTFKIYFLTINKHTYDSFLKRV